MNPTTFRWEEKDGVGRVTFTRPDTLNSLTFGVYGELRDLFRSLVARRDVRSVVLTGTGRGFCSGGDREEIISQLFGRDSEDVYRFARMTCDLVEAMRGAPQPVVAAINGACVGAGAIVAMASDVRLAVPEAKFGFVFTKVGISGADMGATFLLPHIVGWTKATEWLMTGDVFGADEALKAGFLNAVVPADQLAAKASEFAAKFAAGPAFGLAMTKTLLNRQLGASLSQALESEAQAQSLCMLHPDFRTAYEAVKAKKAPGFK
ncbi:MAG: enoyl-CoA hydratase family protein [Candidatus Brocadiae bacterium]|nr:enoyl-CoA hydratase family protein [Candidatus Brocadiia bacterium]